MTLQQNIDEEIWIMKEEIRIKKKQEEVEDRKC